jgi:putative NADPH-quinone reductase
MTHRILVFYGSYRSNRLGIRLAQFVVEGLRGRGHDVELIDAKAVGLPMLDRMYKEYPKGEAPAALEKLAGQIRDADGFVFITGEYNWGIQPGLKKSHRSFSRGVVLAPRRHRQLFGGSFRGRARRNRLAWHALRDGHGGDFEHDRGGCDFADAIRGRQADRRGRKGAGAGVSSPRR